MPQTIIVIGAGIIGAVTALHLVKAGHDVKVVAAGGGYATSAAFGWINASFFLNDDHHRLRAAGIAAWHRMLKDHALHVDWQGCLCWDMTAAQMADTASQLRGFDYPVDVLTAAQIKAMEPALVDIPEQVLFFPNEGAAASHEIAGQFLTAAQNLGAKLISNVSVTGFKMQGDAVVGVQTAQGDLLADQVVVAAGTSTSALARMMGHHVPLVSRPAYIMRTTPQAPLLKHILATPEGEIRQEPDGRILMPIAAGHQGDDAEALTQTPVAAADAAMTRLRKICRGLENAQWSQIIRAERPVPADDLPVVGVLAQGAYVAVLHSGITLGPLIGELIAKDITGSLSNVDAAMLAPYHPDRFAE